MIKEEIFKFWSIIYSHAKCTIDILTSTNCKTQGLEKLYQIEYCRMFEIIVFFYF